MAWMIGIDEAGYGPSLGPLCVAATVWWVEENAKGPELVVEEHLEKVSEMSEKQWTELNDAVEEAKHIRVPQGGGGGGWFGGGRGPGF